MHEIFKENIIKKTDLQSAFNTYFKLNLDDLFNAKFKGNFKEEMFHKGFLACLLCLIEELEIDKKNIDNFDYIDYI